MGLPDWTHTNAVVYSKDDGNIIVSSRHQNWILKVDYADGMGTAIFYGVWEKEEISLSRSEQIQPTGPMRSTLPHSSARTPPACSHSE